MLCSEWDGVKPDITILGACLFGAYLLCGSVQTPNPVKRQQVCKHPAP